MTAYKTWIQSRHSDLAFLEQINTEKSKAKQKVLDKVVKKVYNIRTDCEGVKPTVYCCDADCQQTTYDLLTSTANVLRDIADKNFGGMRPPIIAGGAVRDLVFGLRPKDVDIFIDISDMEDYEAEDHVLLYADYFLERNGREESCFAYKLGETYGERADFLVYETFIDRENQLPFQFIGYRDKRLSSEKPVDFLDTFDYNIIKGLFDPNDMKLHFHDDFIRDLESGKRVIEFSDASLDRVIGFLRKLPKAVRSEWKIKQGNRPAYSPYNPFPLFTTTTGR